MSLEVVSLFKKPFNETPPEAGGDWLDDSDFKDTRVHRFGQIVVGIHRPGTPRRTAYGYHLRGNEKTEQLLLEAEQAERFDSFYEAYFSRGPRQYMVDCHGSVEYIMGWDDSFASENREYDLTPVSPQALLPGQAYCLMNRRYKGVHSVLGTGRGETLSVIGGGGPLVVAAATDMLELCEARSITHMQPRHAATSQNI